MSAIEASEGSQNKKRAPKFKLNKKNLKIIAVLIVLMAIAGGFAYQNKVNNDLKRENARLSNPTEAAKAEADRLKAEVAQLIELPDETPTIATVVDASKLKSQAFFAKAENDDRVLMFAQAKKAVLYRPSTKKIIEVAPINLGDQASSGATQGASTTTPSTTTTTKTKKP